MMSLSNVEGADGDMKYVETSPDGRFRKFDQLLAQRTYATVFLVKQ